MILGMLYAAVQGVRYRAEPQVLSPARRSVVVVVSMLFFVSTALYVGRKLKQALLRRPKEPPGPLFWN